MGTALLAGAVGACDFIESTATNPNAVPQATVDQLFAGIQVNAFFFNESQIARLAAMWTQQMAGTDRQFTSLDKYDFNEEEADGEFSSLYTGGGLVDIRRATAQAEEAGRRVYAGILKIHEAFLIGMGASVFGDLPYSEAVNPEILMPKLDDQAAVYAAVQALLDEAIADLASGEGVSPGGVDLNFGGDAAAWTAVAYTLKARFHMHWGELNGDAAYQAALDAAQNGISSVDGNWRADHSSSGPEQNVWFQFMRDRSGYISSGDYLLPMMVANNDPRLPHYFGMVDTDDDDVPDSYVAKTSPLSPSGVGAADYDLPLVTCAENQFIIAEASYHLGLGDAAVRDAAKAGLACQEDAWGVDLSGIATMLDGLTDEALFNAVMEQKYTALFLNMEVWNDYKRTCLPAITPREGGTVPGRLYYGQSERQRNENIPAPTAGDPGRNDNDPEACTAP
ncbi:MAG TPA: SusD/RagB family nutrient-binding outer membrane lipoprotein [Longimicrobiales bacterium]